MQSAERPDQQEKIGIGTPKSRSNT